MDHLPIPDPSKHEIVPYLDYGLRYDFKGFLGFPSRIGVDLDDLTSSGETFRASPLLDEGHFRLTYALTLEGRYDFDKVLAEWSTTHFDESYRSMPKTGLDESHIKCCLKDTLVEDLCEKGYFIQTRLLTLDGHFDPDTAIPLWINTFVQQWLYFGILAEFESAMELPIDWSKTRSKVSPGSWRVDTNWMAEYGRALVTELLYQRNIPIDLKEGDWVYVDLHDGRSRSDFDQDMQNRWDKIVVDHNLIDPRAHQFGPFKVVELDERLFCRMLDDQELSIKVNQVHHASRTQGIASRTEYFSVASTFRLQELIWTGRTVLTIEDEKPKTKFRESLRVASRYLQRIENYNTRIVRIDLVMSIDILYESLTCALRKLFSQRLSMRSLSSVHRNLDWKMIRKNWCPSRAAKLLSAANTSESYVTSCLDSHDNRYHTGCTEKLCQLRVLDVQHMKLTHNESCCTQTCDLVTFDEAHTIDILRRKGIPGIRQQSSTSGIREFILCDIKGAEYTAISHVWSHGLCNPAGTALYHCQLNDLFKKVRLLKGQRKDVLVWIDTMCIPSDPTCKLSAIADMNNIYANAEIVLILDRQLLQIGDNYVERRFHLLGSEWQTRLWTMQEARLAKTPWVQFKDEAVSVSQLAEKIHPSSLEASDFDLFHDVFLKTGEDIETHFKKSENDLEQWEILSQDMAYRSTTVPTDEPIVLAVAFGLDFLLNSGMPPSMEEVYGSSLLVSRGLLFVPCGRLKTKGFRWAPNTLLNQGSRKKILGTEISDVTAWVSSAGLVTKAHSLILSNSLDISSSCHTTVHIVSVSDDLDIMIFIKSEDFSTREEHFVIERPVIILMMSANEFTDDKVPFSRGIIADLAHEPLLRLKSLGIMNESLLSELFNIIDQELAVAHPCSFIGHTTAILLGPSTMDYANKVLAGRSHLVGPPLTGRLEAEMLVCID